MGIYESYVLLELKSAEVLARESARRATSPQGADTAWLSADLRLLQALPTTSIYGSDQEVSSLGLASPSTAASGLGAQRYQLSCRVRNARDAQLRCKLLTDTALSLGGAFRLIAPATLPDKPIPVSRGSVVFAAAGIGLLAGALWMLGFALLIREPKRARRDPVPRAKPMPSSIPPPNPLGVKSPQLRVLHVAPSNADMSTMSVAQLCNQIYMLAAQGSFLVGVSSWPQDREHKSLVAAQLAGALSAERNARILLVEADFETPAVDRVAQVVMPPLCGFTQQMYLRSEAEQSAPWNVVRYSSSLSVLAEGRLRTPGLLKPELLIATLSELRKSYDIIVADAPVARRSADVRLIERFADGILFAVSDPAIVAETIPSLSKWFGNKELVSIVLPETEA
jgi:Mrp family chromosome partitioning ATPase